MVVDIHKVALLIILSVCIHASLLPPPFLNISESSSSVFLWLNILNGTMLSDVLPAYCAQNNLDTVTCASYCNRLLLLYPQLSTLSYCVCDIGNGVSASTIINPSSDFRPSRYFIDEELNSSVFGMRCNLPLGYTISDAGFEIPSCAQIHTEVEISPNQTVDVVSYFDIFDKLSVHESSTVTSVERQICSSLFHESDELCYAKVRSRIEATLFFRGSGVCRYAEHRRGLVDVDGGGGGGGGGGGDGKLPLTTKKCFQVFAPVAEG